MARFNQAGGLNLNFKLKSWKINSPADTEKFKIIWYYKRRSTVFDSIN